MPPSHFFTDPRKALESLVGRSTTRQRSLSNSQALRGWSSLISRWSDGRPPPKLRFVSRETSEHGPLPRVSTLLIGLLTATALGGCREAQLSSSAAALEGPSVTFRSRNGLQEATWTRTRWEVRGDAFRAEVELTGRDGSEPPVRWKLRDVVGVIAEGTVPAGDGPAVLQAELPRPPPRVLGLSLDVGPPDAPWSRVHRTGPETVAIVVPGGAPRVPHAVVPFAPRPPDIDGVLDDPVWRDAVELGFADSMGRSEAPPPERQTRLLLAYDRSHLYVGFEAQDPDVTERFSARDDPIYEHEAVEVFLMPHAPGPETGPYIELQASPGGVVFDASFTGPRRGMDPHWNGNQTVVSRVDGTLGAPERDTRWVSEWKVPFTSLRWVRKSPGPGDVWRMNAFRIDRSRGQPDLYVAWSPPRVGDFHRVERFGFIEFGTETSTSHTP